MRRRRTTITIALASVATALLAVSPAQAATPGTGTSSGGAEALHLRIGDGALDLRIGTESSNTTNETTAGPASAVERLVPLSLSSTLVPALSGLSTPALETSSTGEERSTSSPGLDLGALSASSPVPGLLGGTLDPTTLRALVDAAGSVADAAGGASGISVLGGVLRLGELQALLGSDALVEGAGAGRLISLDRIEVLDLAAVLQLLGLDIDDLSLDAAAGILEQLGLPLPGGAVSAQALVSTVQGLLAQAGTVPEQVAALNAQITALEGQIAQLVPLTTVCSPLDPVLALLGVSCATVASTIASLQAQVTSLVAQIDVLLDSIINVINPLLAIVAGLVTGLDAAPLVVVENLAVGVVADAVDTLEGSTASVTGSVGAVKVGNLTLPGLDAIALADQATAAVGQVLSVLDPALAGLVDIDLLTQSSSVRADGRRNIAEAALTGLRLTITPPDLCGLLGRLGVAETLTELVGRVGQTVPALPLPLPVADVLGDLGSTVTCTATTGAATSGGPTVGAQLVGGLAPALTQPLSVEVLSVNGTSAFEPTRTTETGAAPTLPLTGGPSTPIALVGVAAAGALALRRLLARAA